MSCWIRLGIEPTQDLDAIRLAYRGRLPAHHPETDPEGFQALREAYEQALRLAREDDLDPDPETHHEPPPPHPALQRFYTILEEPSLRFDPPVWQAYIAELDELPLNELDDISKPLLHALYDSGPLSHNCVNLLAKRMAWADQLLRLDNPQQIEALLNRFEQPDPFDTGLMRDWPPAAQMETLWYFRSLEYTYQQRPLFEYADFVSTHTCLAIPDDPVLLQRLIEQFCHAAIPSQTFYAQLQARKEQGEDNADLLYMLATQANALGAEEQALECWLRLYREYQHPQAERWLLELCAHHQPQRLPLLIQAFDRLSNPDSWPAELDDAAHLWGSPGQTPQTLSRWAEASHRQLGGIAATFIDWRLDGDDELPLLAWLLQIQDDSELHRLYWQAWALQRGESGLLRLILEQRPSDDPLDGLIIEGFQRQAAQQLHWLEHNPVALALAEYCRDTQPGAEMPAGLLEDSVRSACREWLRRMRQYSAQAVYELNRHFDMPRMFTVPFAMKLQGQMAEDGVTLPPMPEGDALWQWHRQQLFMLATLDQPTRWLAMIDPALAGQLQYPPEHQFAATHNLLLNHQGGGLLGSLDRSDAAQATLATRLSTLQRALESERLPQAELLADCLDNDDGSLLEDNALGYLLLCAALYHDRSLDEERRTRLRNRLEAVDLHGAWFDPWRRDLVNGKLRTPPSAALREYGLDKTQVDGLIDALEHLLVQCTLPNIRALRALLRIKDNPSQPPGLRCAAMAVLSWSERMLNNDAQQPQPALWAFWKLKSRLNRTGYGLHLLAVIVSGVLMLRSPWMMAAMSVVLVLIMVSGTLRRLRDLGRGVPSLLVLLALSRVVPFLPLVLLGAPGDKLPNRYGPPPGVADPLQGGLQATLRRLDGQ